ncbi:MAG TPA: single-stranded-DNA-specific exonuclease RecJ [Myxococcaceae bacterium]|nr:single-stranded-DNA-specific exonuclease RecJ [Myxococcaceae bacterium]
MPATSPHDVTPLISAFGLHPLAARVLSNRGYATPDTAAAFLADGIGALPNPFLLKGLRAAVLRVCDAIRSGQRITLYGDFDVDGVCSTALLALFLRELGANVSTYIPNRLGEGYGLNLAAIETLAQQGTRVLITLDCGTTSVAEVSRANALGLDVIVIDHHSIPSQLPPALALINPHQPGCDYPTRHLCAAGVAFNFCLGLRKELREQGFFEKRREPNLRSMLDLVALATIADVVPLTGANRILVKHGLEEIARAARPGIRALKEVAGIFPGPMSTGQVGFRLGPRINAAGRLHDASLGLQLLCAETIEAARPLAHSLDAANLERQRIEQDILAQALRQVEQHSQTKALVLHSELWHPGVIGIVASRVVERFHRPTVLVAVKEGIGRGSARSIDGFHLVSALQDCAGHLLKYGGHRQAAGLSIEASRLPAFSQAFAAVAAQKLSDEDIVPCCRVDAVVSLSELSPEAAKGIEVLGPFGPGNPEPIFASCDLAARPQVVASKREGRAGHLKLRFDSAPRLGAIGFGMAEQLPLAQQKVDLAYQLSVEQWNGMEQLSLRLKALRASTA